MVPLPRRCVASRISTLSLCDVQVDQVRRLAANDDPVVAGVFQLRPEEAAEQRMRHQVRLRRKRVHDGAVGAGRRRAVQQAGAEDQQIVGRERIDVGRNPFQQDLGGDALPAQIKLGRSLGSVSTFSMLPRDRSISRLNPVSAYLIFLPLHRRVRGFDPASLISLARSSARGGLRNRGRNERSFSQESSLPGRREFATTSNNWRCQRIP